MVNTQKRTPPDTDRVADSDRKILDGPCLVLADVQELVRREGYKAVNVATQDASGEMAEYCMDEQDLVDLILTLRTSNYNDSEWCKFSPKSPWFEADSYRIRKVEKLPSERDVSQCSYYLKFSKSKLGSLLLFFSVHRDIL